MLIRQTLYALVCLCLLLDRGLGLHPDGCTGNAGSVVVPACLAGLVELGELPAETSDGDGYLAAIVPSPVAQPLANIAWQPDFGPAPTLTLWPLDPSVREAARVRPPPVAFTGDRPHARPPFRGPPDSPALS